MRPGWNPTRRNRHAGTKAHGHGAGNRLVIPETWHRLQRFYECLADYVAVKRQVGHRTLTFLVQPTRPDWFHPCSIGDACTVLSHLPPEDLDAFDFVVMRQPTRKQRLLSPVWGRAVFAFDLDGYSGKAIVLETQTLAPFKWQSSLSPERKRELDRLAADGHGIRKTRRGLEIHPTAASLRSTVLYRTLPHEVGHHVDMRQCPDGEWDGRTPASKEDFAHRYAAEHISCLRQGSIVPFDPVWDDEAMQGLGLRREWFHPAPAMPGTP